MRRSLIVILGVAMLDAVGMGLVMPILPGLLRELGHSDSIAGQYGLLVALYALMQFLFAPLLGLLSDRFGRRPVLLVSLAGAALDYLVMAVTPALWVLYVGRILAGITGANMAVASAYIADITPEEKRAQRFGWLSAAFGVGFILGPALGGWLGAESLRAPFLAAALFNGLNFLVGLFLLPEPQRERSRTLVWRNGNPFRALHAALRGPALGSLLTVFTLTAIVGYVAHVMWVIFGQDRFGWDIRTVGLSLTVFGALHALSQAVVAGPVVKWFGERRAFAAACIVDAIGYAIIGVATQGWIMLAVIPLLCLGGVAQPSLQAMLSARVGPDKQGELQGLLAGLMSIAGIASPLAFTAIYDWTRPIWPGAVWLIGALFYVPCLLLLLRVRTVSAAAEEAAAEPAAATSS